MRHHFRTTLRVLGSGVAVAALAVLMISAVTAAAPIRVLLIDGESAGTYHDWQRTTPVLRKMLDETALFDVTVVTAAASTGVATAFQPDFSKHQVVVMNYDAPDDRWPAELKTSFEQYVRNGGGLV